MPTAWNKTSKRYISRINTPDLDAMQAKDANWLADPAMNDGTPMHVAIKQGVRPGNCKASGGVVYPMTSGEIATRDAAREAARQSAKPPATRARENAYRDLCVKHGLPESVDAEGGLQAALEAELVVALAEIANPQISAAFALVQDALTLQNLATKVDVADIPAGGHTL